MKRMLVPLAACVTFGLGAALASEPASTGVSATAPVGSAGCSRALPAGVIAGTTTMRTVNAGGSKRTYLLHVPAGYDSGAPAPVVLNFHGFGSNPEKQNAITAFEPLSDREGFILVTPDGGIGWRFAQSAREENTAFVRDLVASVKSELCVDEKRIFATGKSQGGFMSSWLGCMAPDIVAAIAPVAGMYEPPAACAPMSILEMHGKADKMIPYGGGHVLMLGTFAGAEAVMDQWAHVNQCAGAKESVALNPHVQRVTYQNCAATTIQYQTDAGHTWPGSTVREGDNTKSADLDASGIIWEFFKAHPKP